MKLPKTLSVIVLAASVGGCGDDPASAPDAAVADATATDAAGGVDAAAPDASAGDATAPDAGCRVFEVFDPTTGRCEPVA